MSSASRGLLRTTAALAALIALATASGDRNQCGQDAAAGSCAAAVAQDLQLMQVRRTRSTVTRYTPLVEHGSEIHAGDNIFLTAANRKRVSVNGTRVFAEWDHYGSWEVLRIEKRRGRGVLRSGDHVYLAAHNHEVIAVNGTAVVASFVTAQAEYLQIVRRDGAGKVRAGDAVFFKAHGNLTISLNGTTIVAGHFEAADNETFLVDAPAESDDNSTETVTTTPSAPAGHWEVESVGECDPQLGCHRDLVVTCQGEGGSRLPDRLCDPSTKPAAYEACLSLGQGSCIDVAESDCLDVPGCWWNRWRRTCGELAEAGACEAGSAPAGLDSWEDGDTALVRRACSHSCGLCSGPSPHAPTHVDSRSCDETVCEDDVVYRTPFGSGCFRWVGRDCNSVFFKEDLKAACPKACGLCSA